MLTNEKRIFLEFQKMKHQNAYKRSGPPAIYLYLARVWARPISEIKAIVKNEGRSVDN